MDLLFWSGWTFFRLSSLLLLRAQVRGVEHIPRQGPFILACNHISYFDPPLVGSWVPRGVYFMAKAELFRPRPIGWLLRAVHARPVRRGVIDRRALQQATEILEAGRPLVMFPEGTRARRGEFLPPKPGLGMVAVTARCPIVPAYVSGLNHLRKCLLFRDRFRLRFGPPLKPEWLESLEPAKESYVRVAAEVMKRIKELRDTG